MPGPGFEKIVTEENAKIRTEQARKNGHAAVTAGAEFSALGEDRYRLSFPAIGVTFEVDRLRRQFNELVGELSVRCDLPGARTVEGNLSIADFNVSSARARSERAKLLASRANTRDVDWTGLVEQFCVQVLQADRNGKPAVDLRTLPRPTPDDEFQVDGIYLLRKHPAILFGDGGTAKSYFGLFLAGRLAKRGMRVAIFDWELDGQDHRDRLERLFPDEMPQILYCRCDRPLVHEADRLRRIVRENRIEYLVYDSVAFACDGPPEAAEAAGRYFRAVRQIGGGSLHVAHVSKAEGADQKPFGSVFWHNSARATWYAKLADNSAETDVLHIGLYNRKANLGRIRPPIAFTITFTEDRAIFKRSDISDNADLARSLSVRQRMAALLRKGPMTPEAIAEQIEADAETVKRTLRRCREQFVIIPDGRAALLEKRAS